MASTSPFITASMAEKVAMPNAATRKAMIGSWRGLCIRQP
jgi:hypothetical protein